MDLSAFKREVGPRPTNKVIELIKSCNAALTEKLAQSRKAHAEAQRLGDEVQNLQHVKQDLTAELMLSIEGKE